MVVTDTEHLPAAALALGFALNCWDLSTIAVVLLGTVCLTAIREAGKPAMIDLLQQIT